MDGQIEVKVRCAKCGGNKLVVPDESKDSSIVTCQSCGTQIGKWGDVKAAALKKAKEEVQASIRKAFKGNKHISLE
jgi:ribosomal protein S27E